MNTVLKRMKNYFGKREVKAVLSMFLGSTLIGVGAVFIVQTGNFYSGGVTGISQLLSRIVNLATGKNLPLTSIFMGVLNIPLIIISWKGVSKRFAILTVIALIYQMLLIFFLEMLLTSYPDLSLFKDIAIRRYDQPHLNIEEVVIDGVQYYDNRAFGLILAIFGGLVSGFGSGIVLKNGASSGGVDLLSQYLSLKKDYSFISVSFCIDFTIISAAGIIGFIETKAQTGTGSILFAVYTLIRMIVALLVMDRVHTTYKYINIKLVTIKKDEMRESLISKFNHGITIYQAVGGYSMQEKWVFDIIVAQHEYASYYEIAKHVDDKVFITYTAVKKIDGNFNKNVIT